LYIIDVSQSVDLDHPHALDFLREDCLHISVCSLKPKISN
jgi:RIO kinase 1